MNPTVKRILVWAWVVFTGVFLILTGLYGWTLFVVMPILLGGVVAVCSGSETAGQAMLRGALANVVVSALFLLAGAEGLICIAMALPLTTPLGGFGGWVAYSLKARGATTVMPVALVLLPAGMTGIDMTAKAPLFEVRTAIEINAPPEMVWKHVTSFSDLAEPADWYFRAGLAYPKRASIDGVGVGAVRRCEFSTGAFVEPIEVWEAPRLLRFSVTENPPPMHEWSPYANLVPRHLNGYMISKRGQFELHPLPGGRTRLEGTTWYVHSFWPSQYWRLWSDAIIHRIHTRVLTHIRGLAESETPHSFQ